MAQWIPKTAWKVTNLNKRYGQQVMTRGTPSGSSGEAAMEAYAALHSECLLGKDEVRQRLQAHMAAATAQREGKQKAAGNTFTGAVVLDLRDAAERRRQPLSSVSPLVVSVHPHDLASGAVAPLLPYDKKAAELFVVASGPQRAVNGSASLRRLGYERVSIIDVETAKASLAVQ